MAGEHSSEHPDDDGRLILAVLRRVNECWQRGEPAAASDCFHERAVVFHPDFRGRLDGGREAVLESYETFNAEAVVIEFTESDPVVDVWGHTAVASYAYRMVYRMRGGTFRDTGRDVFVLTKEFGAWLITARSVLVAEQVRVG